MTLPGHFRKILTMKNSNILMLLGAGVLILAIVLFFKNRSPVTNPQPVTTPTVSDTNLKTIDLEAGSFYYKPNQITLKKGEKVKIVLHAVSMMHDFNIDELNIKLPVTKNGETGSVEFTADKVGTFEYYCSVGQHRKLGQVGKLTVTE